MPEEEQNVALMPLAFVACAAAARLSSEKRRFATADDG